MASKIQNNNMSLEEILATINALPEEGSGGVELPELSNPGSASELLANYELIDGEGKKVIGTMPDNGAISSTMDGLETKSVSIPAGYTSGGTVVLDSTIDNTANSQATQIDEIMELLEEKSAGCGGSGGTSIETCTVIVRGADVYPKYVSYTSANSEGKLLAKDSSSTSGVHICNNVACGSAVTVRWNSNSGSFALTNCTAVYTPEYYFSIFSIDALPGETAIIESTAPTVNKCSNCGSYSISGGYCNSCGYPVG